MCAAHPRPLLYPTPLGFRVLGYLTLIAVFSIYKIRYPEGGVGYRGLGREQVKGSGATTLVKSPSTVGSQGALGYSGFRPYSNSP